MQYVILKKSNLDSFISKMAEGQKVYAPVSKGYNQYAFESVTTAKDISVKYIPTILPPKKFFMPQREKLLTYDTQEGQNMNAEVECEKLTIFGVHTCDLAGIHCLNMVFSERPKDYHYLARKNEITIIGLECNDYCDEYASCKLVDNHLPNGGYDLFFTDIGEEFMVHVNTAKGEDLVKTTNVFEKAEKEHFKGLEDIRAKKREIFKNEVPMETKEVAGVFEKSFDSKVWEDVGKRCISCGNCTAVCPTCYCFDVVDEPELELAKGQRYRRWDSCQLEPFAAVAGGENFREERSSRQKHRYYRKFKYPVEKFARYFCTGCGRCTRTCMSKINLKETLTSLKEEMG